MVVLVCPEVTCQRKFSRQYNLNRHYEKFHLNSDICEKCFLCGQIFNSCDDLQKHYRRAHKPSKQFFIKNSAFKKAFVEYTYTFSENDINYMSALHCIKNLVEERIIHEAATKVVCKVSLIFICQMSMLDHAGDKLDTAKIVFRAPSFFANASLSKNVRKNIQKSFNHHSSTLEDFIKNGSGWVFDRALSYNMEIGQVKPIVAGNGKNNRKRSASDAELNNKPAKKAKETKPNISNFKNKKFLYNPENKNQKCFLYCIAHFLYSDLLDKSDKRSKERQLKKYIKKFDVSNITFPISVQGIKRFLKQNKNLNLKVNILFRSYTGKCIYPYEFGLGSGKKIVNLLMIYRKTGSNHFLLITNVNKYLRQIYKSPNGTTSYQRSFFCLHCLNSFSSQKILTEHEENCIIHKPRKEVVPTEGNNIIKFKNFERQHPLEYIAFLDFECVLPKKDNYCSICSSLKCKCDASFTDIISEQKPIAYNFLVLGPNDKVIHEHSYFGDNAGFNVIEHLLCEEKRWIKNLLDNSKEMLFTHDDFLKHESATNCYICDRSFVDEDIVKCRDHSHISAKYLGAACNRCNLRRQKPNKLKIFIHNGSRYDFHFLVSALGDFGNEIQKIKILPYNGENFRTLSFNSFEFIDSLAFLQAPLAQLCSDLKNTEHDYSILKQTYLVKTNGVFDKEKYDMVLEKSFFPYEFCTSLQQMTSIKKIPKQKHFYSSLTEEGISKENYNFAKKVWKKFNCKNLLQYTNLYCKIDTVLLAEVFQKFRKDMQKFSGLDPAYYISLPAYSYDSMLKITDCEIGLPTDINQVSTMYMLCLILSL